MAFPITEACRRAIRNGAATTYTVNATRGGVSVAAGLRPVGGTITDTTKAGVRRVLNLNLAPAPGLFDLLSPIGTTLTVTGRVQFTDRTTVDIPMGVFDVDSETLSEGSGGLSLTAPDKWARIQRARFVQPWTSTVTTKVTDLIATLIRGVFGAGEVVSNLTTRNAVVGSLTFEKDRDKAIIDLAASIGAWVYFDRYGVATIDTVPTAGVSADWLVDASAAGVLTSLDRERSRTSTYNVVVVESSAATDSAFPTQIVWDNDPASPTYAGTNPITSPSSAGPFGLVPYFYDTPLLLDAPTAFQTGRTILARTAGLASQVSLGQVPNPALDAFDTLDVMPPRERCDISRVLERHVADTVTHPLTVRSEQQVAGRSTRTDEFT